MKAVRLNIAGHVQGVGFRAWTRRTAIGLGLHGWVRNEPGGGVTAHAEGEETALDRFIAACHRGPTGASVDRVSVDDVPVENIPGFSQR